MVDDYDGFDIEIVQWPAQSWRAVDAGTGNEAGTAEGVFHSQWKGQVLFGTNNAVNGEYILAWSDNPGNLDEGSSVSKPNQVLLWYLSYHPFVDGNQRVVFFCTDIFFATEWPSNSYPVQQRVEFSYGIFCIVTAQSPN